MNFQMLARVIAEGAQEVFSHPESQPATVLSRFGMVNFPILDVRVRGNDLVVVIHEKWVSGFSYMPIGD